MNRKISRSEGTTARGKSCKASRTRSRDRSLPSASSPITNGCARTSPLSGGGTRAQSPARGWSIQTDYRPGSLRLRPPTRGCDQIGLAAAQVGKTAGGFALDQCLERFADHGGFAPQTGENLRLGQQFVVDCEGRTHGSASERHELIIVRC